MVPLYALYQAYTSEYVSFDFDNFFILNVSKIEHGCWWIFFFYSDFKFELFWLKNEHKGKTIIQYYRKNIFEALKH